MKELFLKTENGNVQIDQNQIDKYNIKEGDISPSCGYHIVDKYGNENKELKKEKLSTHHTLDEMYQDGIIFTTSETQDIARGADN